MLMPAHIAVCTAVDSYAVPLLCRVALAPQQPETVAVVDITDDDSDDDERDADGYTGR